MKRRLSLFLATTTLATLAIAPSAFADGWSWYTYFPPATVGQYANKYGGWGTISQADAEVESHGYGCSNIVAPNTGWVFPMACQPAGYTSFSQIWGSGNYGQAMAWNNWNGSQRMAGAGFYYLVSGVPA